MHPLPKGTCRNRSLTYRKLYGGLIVGDPCAKTKGGKFSSPVLFSCSLPILLEEEAGISAPPRTLRPSMPPYYSSAGTSLEDILVAAAEEGPPVLGQCHPCPARDLPR